MKKVENHNLAVRIYDALNAKGAGLGNVSIGIIERVINGSPTPPQMEYETFQRSNDWVAHIKGHIELWECGATEEEAVEKLRATRGNLSSEQPEGTCACRKKPEEHLSRDILTMHHYTYFHYGYVAGCRYCDELKDES